MTTIIPKIGKLYKIEPDAVRTEAVDIMDPETGEVLWPIFPHTYRSEPWGQIPTTPLLLVMIQPADTELAAEQGSLREADKDKLEYFFLFQEKLVTTMYEDVDQFGEHFYEVTG